MMRTLLPPPRTDLGPQVETLTRLASTHLDIPCLPGREGAFVDELVSLGLSDRQLLEKIIAGHGPVDPAAVARLADEIPRLPQSTTDFLDDHRRQMREVPFEPRWRDFLEMIFEEAAGCSDPEGVVGDGWFVAQVYDWAKRAGTSNVGTLPLEVLIHPEREPEGRRLLEAVRARLNGQAMSSLCTYVHQVTLPFDDFNEIYHRDRDLFAMVSLFFVGLERRGKATSYALRFLGRNKGTLSFLFVAPRFQQALAQEISSGRFSRWVFVPGLIPAVAIKRMNDRGESPYALTWRPTRWSEYCPPPWMHPLWVGEHDGYHVFDRSLLHEDIWQMASAAFWALRTVPSHLLQTAAVLALHDGLVDLERVQQMDPAKTLLYWGLPLATYFGHRRFSDDAPEETRLKWLVNIRMRFIELARKNSHERLKKMMRHFDLCAAPPLLQGRFLEFLESYEPALAASSRYGVVQPWHQMMRGTRRALEQRLSQVGQGRRPPCE